MDTHESLEYVNDFARRIESMSTSLANERFVRELISDIAYDCPLHVLKEIAECVLSIRRRELDKAGREN